MIIVHSSYTRLFSLSHALYALTSMSQAESPQTQVGCSVGDGTQAVLNGVDGLVNKRLREIKLSMISPSISLLLPNVLGLLCIVKDLFGLVSTVITTRGGWLTIWSHVVGARTCVATLW